MNTASVIPSVDIEIVNGLPTTTSIDVAHRFKKRHDTVLRRIGKLDCSPEFTDRNFAVSGYIDSTGRKLKQYRMTRDGFVFLCMGFTGKEAAQWKEAYINAFNTMEAELLKRQQALPNPLTPEHQHGLRKAIARRVQTLPKGIQRLAYARLYSHLHDRFSVAKYDQIDDSRYTEALAAVETCEMEGEFIAAPADPDALILSHQDQQHLFQILSHLHWVHKVWHECRIGTALKMLGSPAPIRMREHLFVANLHRRELVKRHGDALRKMRRRSECAGTRLAL